MTSEMFLMCVYSSVVYRVIGKYCLISNNSKSSWWQSNIIASVMCCKLVPAKVRAKWPALTKNILMLNHIQENKTHLSSATFINH